MGGNEGREAGGSETREVSGLWAPSGCGGWRERPGLSHHRNGSVGPWARRGQECVEAWGRCQECLGVAEWKRGL